MKDGRGKALRDARLVVRWNVITYQTKKQYKFSVCILYPVCSLHFEPSLHFVPGLQSAVCSLQSAVCSLHFVLTRLVSLVLFERAWSPDRNIGARKKNLVRLYVEELPRTSTMIEQWLLYTNWGRTQMRGLPILLPLMLLCVITACVKVNPLRATQVWTFRLLDSNCILRSSEMWFKVVIFIKPYKHFISSHLSFWGGGGVACETTSVHGPQCNFRLRNTISFRPRSTTSVNICFTTVPHSLLSAKLIITLEVCYITTE